MSLENRFNEINNELEKFQKETESIFNKLVNNIKTPQIQEKIQHFKEVEISRISTSISQTRRVINSPIYVGFLGRYSHGKTALINEFFSIRQEYSLPEGEGMVTSKITQVVFAQISSPHCEQVFRGKNSISISIDTLKASVGGQAIDANTEMIDYYSIQLPAKEPFSELFEKKKIHLIDMPGLGGLYFRDNEKTRKYMEYIDMLIVVIKITKIEEASQYIEPYIHNLSIPIIPVLTFFDKWKESDVFATCTDEEEVVIKAKQLIKDKIPSLSKYEIRTMAVSSKTRLNINELRECVLNFVETQNLLIDKAPSETPEVFRRRVNEISKELNKITIDAENSLNRLQREIQSLIPSNQRRFESFDQSFKKQKDRLIADSKRKISQAIKNIFSDFKDVSQDIMYRNNPNEIKEYIDNFEQKINLTKFTELNAEINDLLLIFKTNLSDAVNSYIDKLDIDELKRQELRQSTFDTIENSQSEIDNPIQYKAPLIIDDVIKGVAKITIDVITDNLTNPQLILPLLVVPIIVTLKSLPLIGDKFAPVVDSVLIILVVAFIWKVISSDRTKRMNEVKRNIVEKLLSSFDRQKIQDDSYRNFLETVEKIQNLVKEDLQETIDNYSKDVETISSQVKKFQLEVKTIDKFLQRQIAIIDSEQV